MLDNFESKQQNIAASDSGAQQSSESLLADANGTHPSFSKDMQDHYDRLNVAIHICVGTHQEADAQAKCWEDGQKVWNAELNTTVQSLQQDFKDNPAAQQQLSKSQDEWNSFRDKEFEALDKLYDSAPANLEVAPDKANDKTWVVETRVKELQAMRDGALMPLNPGEPMDQRLHACLAANKTDSGQQNCLQRGIDGWNKELNNQYKALSPSQLSAVSGAQEQWKTFQKAEESLLELKYPKNPDDKTTPNRSLAASLNLLRDRAIQMSLREADHF